MTEFTVACPVCGEVVGLCQGGERVPDAIHVCPGHDDLDRELEEEGRRGGGTPAA